MLRLAFDFIITWRETRTRPNAYANRVINGKTTKRLRHYKIFCVNGNTGFRNESRIFYFIHLQNEEAYERKESSSA